MAQECESHPHGPCEEPGCTGSIGTCENERHPHFGWHMSTSWDGMDRQDHRWGPAIEPPAARGRTSRMNAIKDRARATATRTGPATDPYELAAKADGMQRAVAATPQEFQDAFISAARQVAETIPENITVDDIWAVLAQRGVDTERRQGVGPLMARCTAMGLFQPVEGEASRSARPGSKARFGNKVYRSLLFDRAKQ